MGGAGGGPRAVLKAPFSEGGGRFGGGGKKQKKKKDMVLPVEKLTQDPTPRAPQNEAERVEVDEWIKERRKHFPTTSNMAKKEQELKERAARGELEVLRYEGPTLDRVPAPATTAATVEHCTSRPSPVVPH